MKFSRYILIIIFLALPSSALSYSIENGTSEVSGVIGITPGKFEMDIAPGESRTVDLLIENKLDKRTTFYVSAEDLSPDNSKTGGFGLNGGESGPYPFKDYVQPEINTFTLDSGSRMILPLTVNIPLDAEESASYGTVLVTELSPETNSGSGTYVRSRLGSLFLIRINDSNLAGSLAGFKISSGGSFVFLEDPYFISTFSNEGNVHLNPYGFVEVTNIFGKTVDSFPVEPWFVLPGVTRSKAVGPMDTSWRIGFYKAELSLNRGYEDIIDSRSLSYFIISIEWLILISVFAVLVISYILRAYLKKTAMSRLYMKGSQVVFLGALFFLANAIVFASVASSTNFQLERDSINIGGQLSSSTNFSLEDTVGEVATGYSSSTNFTLHAGYQQVDSESTITITSPDDITLLPNISTNGGQANGSATWTVTTNDSNGYVLYIEASTDPAMQGSAGNFANYTTSGSPEFTWGVDSSAREFGFTPEGSDIASAYLDNGSDTCGVGATDTSSSCWDEVLTSTKTIASSGSANSPSGTGTTVRFRAEAGSANNPPVGTYQAVITLTAVTQ